MKNAHDTVDPALSGDDFLSNTQKRSRRLSDKILTTFHAACDVREFQVARQLLATLEWLMMRSGFKSPLDRRRNTEALVAAHERLWNLRHGSSLV